MNYGYCDFFPIAGQNALFRYRTQLYPGVEIRYVQLPMLNLKPKQKKGRQQLLRYSKDKVVQKLATGTTLHLLLIQFQGWDMVKCEEINASAIHPSE